MLSQQHTTVQAGARPLLQLQCSPGATHRASQHHDTQQHLVLPADTDAAACRAFKRQAWSEAVTRYTAAVAACDNASPAFAAVLHSNRAAAYQALKAWPEAIADCLRSRALDPSFTKVKDAWMKSCP